MSVFGAFTRSDSTYLLTAASGNAGLALVADRPIYGSVAGGAIVYYAFPVTGSSELVSVSVTAISGDPGEQGEGGMWAPKSASPP